VQRRIKAYCNALTSFQSSPVLSDRCNWLGCANRVIVQLFQSSPVLSDRCNQISTSPLLFLLLVSILTGPFGPVQRGLRHKTASA